MVVKFLSKQSPETTILQTSQSLELVTIMIVINIVTGGFSRVDLIDSCNCPITGVNLQSTVQIQL